MRLKEYQVKQICQRILQTLRAKHLITFLKSEPECMSKMVDIFIKNLRVEDEINREAERLVEQYTRNMGDKIDREKMFQMIKKQLIKDKNVIL